MKNINIDESDIVEMIKILDKDEDYNLFLRVINGQNINQKIIELQNILKKENENQLEQKN